MRRRILLAIGGTLLVMLIIISLASSALLRDSYAGLERRYMERDMQRILADFSRQETGLGRTAGDYAASTDLYRYVQHPNVAITDRMFTDEGAANLNLQIVVVLDNAGKVQPSVRIERGTSRCPAGPDRMDRRTPRADPVRRQGRHIPGNHQPSAGTPVLCRASDPGRPSFAARRRHPRHGQGVRRPGRAPAGKPAPGDGRARSTRCSACSRGSRR